MPRASRHDAVPPEPPDLAAIAAGMTEAWGRAVAVLGRVERIADAGEAGAPLPGETDLHHLALIIAGLRQLGSGLEATAGELSRLSLESRLAGACLAAERAEGLAQGRQEGAQAVRHSHRKPRHPKPPDGQVIPFRGRAVTGAIAAASLAAGAAGVTLGPGAVSDLARWAPAPAHHAAAALPSLGPASAVLVPSSSAPPAYVPRHAKPSADAARATLAPPASPSRAPSPPSSSPAPAVSPVAFTGSLNPQTDHLVIAPFRVVRLTFSAVGGSVSWAATAPAGVVLSVSSGILSDGQPQVIRVSVPAGTPAGAGVIVVTDGRGRSFQVPVTWAAVPLV